MNAALEVVDQVGFDALTIRAVAAAVNAPPMSLYTHFANKEELLDLMYLEVSRRLYPDSGQLSWQLELLTLARHVRATLLAHPGWTPLLARRVVATSVTVRERILTLMVDAGMSADDALNRLSSAVIATIGLVLVELRFRGSDGGSRLASRFDRLKTWFHQHDDPQQAMTREAFARASDFGMEKTFECMIQGLIAGLEQRTPSAG